MKIGTYIAAMRHRRGITQEDLARILAISPGSVGLWESGKTNPKVSRLPDIAAALRCRVDDLLGTRKTKTAP